MDLAEDRIPRVRGVEHAIYRRPFSRKDLLLCIGTKETIPDNKKSAIVLVNPAIMVHTMTAWCHQNILEKPELANAPANLGRGVEGGVERVIEEERRLKKIRRNNEKRK